MIRLPSPADLHALPLRLDDPLSWGYIAGSVVGLVLLLGCLAACAALAWFLGVLISDALDWLYLHAPGWPRRERPAKAPAVASCACPELIEDEHLPWCDDQLHAVRGRL